MWTCSERSVASCVIRWGNLHQVATNLIDHHDDNDDDDDDDDDDDEDGGDQDDEDGGDQDDDDLLHTKLRPLQPRIISMACQRFNEL